MKSLFWKEFPLDKKRDLCPNIELGATLTYLPDKNKYVYFGGLSKETFISEQSELERKEQEEREKEEIKQQSLYYRQDYLKMKKANSADHMYIYCPVKNQWRRVRCTGKMPTKRVFLESFYMGGFFFVLGGKDKHKNLADLFVLDLRSLSDQMGEHHHFGWRRFFQLEGPKARLHPHLLKVGSEFVRFGGVSFPENIPYDDYWKLRFENVPWNSDVLELSGLVWEKLNIIGDRVYLKYAGSTMINADEALVFGGYDIKGCPLTSLSKINWKTCRAEAILSGGKKPCARAYHKFQIIKPDKIVVYGGTSSSEEQIQQGQLKILNDLFIYNVKQQLWEEPLVGGNFPSGRLLMSYSCNFPQSGGFSGELILLGGTELLSAPASGNPVFTDMKLYLLGQTDGQNWKVEEQMKEVSTVFEHDSEDDDTEQEMPAQKTHLSDKEILEEEYSKSEILIQKLKQEVSEMEVNLKKERLRNQEMKENTFKNQQEAKKVDEDTKTYLDIKGREIAELKERKASNEAILKTLLDSLAYKLKQRKIIQARRTLLEQGFEATEEYIIHLDKFFSDTIQQASLDTILKPSLFNEIVKKKEEHTQILIKFRQQYEETLKAEQKISETQEKLYASIKSLNVEAALLSKLTDKQQQFLKGTNLLK